MLVQFSLKNVLSFHDEVVFDMTAVGAYKEHEENTIDIGQKEKYLRVASIYGANASGKSNLFFAFSLFQKIIVESMNNVPEGEETVISHCYLPFRFTEERGDSEYQICLIANEKEYRYGYAFNDKEINNEWLYVKNEKTNRNVMIFERDKQNMNFGASVRKECEAYKDQVPMETLALSFFSKLKLKNTVFTELYAQISKILVLSSGTLEKRDLIYKVLPGMIDKRKKSLLDFLSAIDVGIKDISYTKNEGNYVFITYHDGITSDASEKKRYSLELFSESEGTIKCILVFIYSSLIISNNGTIFFDELNVKLHPLLLKYVINLFYTRDSQAQLIYSSHDVTLMNKIFFRRDQIWFVSKDERGFSELFSLSDFKIRSDASFEKDYLSGVYGGIPFLNDFSFEED